MSSTSAQKGKLWTLSRFAAYYAILHMVTAAIGSRAHYTLMESLGARIVEPQDVLRLKAMISAVFNDDVCRSR